MAPTADGALFVSLFFTGGLGTILNAFLLVLIMRKKEMRQSDYIIFIANRTLVDLAYSLQSITLQPISIQIRSVNQTWCSVAGGAATSLLLSTIFCELVLACNRYVSMCHKQRHQRMYTKRTVPLVSFPRGRVLAETRRG